MLETKKLDIYYDKIYHSSYCISYNSFWKKLKVFLKKFNIKINYIILELFY